jgi:hypothetical protein
MSAEDMSALASMVMPKAVFMTLQAGNVTGGDMTFTVPYAAKVIPMDSKEIAAVVTYNKPLMGIHNVTTGSGTISAADALPAMVSVDYSNRSAIPVAGASMVIALQDFKMTGMPKGKGMYNFQFGSITAYLPDGTAKSLKLDKPLRLSMNMDQMKLSFEGSPTLVSWMTGLYKPGVTFPAGAAPVRLNDILAAR